jgi:hypothetical protein
LLKRLYQLALRNDKQVSLEVQLTQSDLVIDGRSAVELVITAGNMYLIKVNGLRLPVPGNAGSIKVSLKVEKEVRSITVYGRGIRHRKTFRVPVNDKRLVARNIRMKQKSIVKMPVVFSRVVKPKRPSLIIKPLIIQKKSSFPILLRTPFIRYQALTEDLLEKFAHNSKTNEQ